MSRTGIYEAQLSMDDALARVGPDWAEIARHAIADLCETGATFTAEDVRRLAGDPPGSPNAMGALLHAIADEGWIRMVGTVKSTRPNAHGRRVIVWQASA